MSDTYDAILADQDSRIQNCTLEDGLDRGCYAQQSEDNILNFRANYPLQAGFFHLRNIYKTEGLMREVNEERVKRIMTPSKGGQEQGYDWSKDEGAKSAKEKFDAAIRGSYANTYQKLVEGGDLIYDDIRATAWHVFGQYVKELGNHDEALSNTLTTLFGDTVLEQNGGVEFPNGVGLWHDRAEMNKRGITLSMIEQNRVNAYYHIHNKYGSDLLFEPYRDMDKNWNKVAQEMLNGGGNVWWTLINDVDTDGYRVVVVGQYGVADKSVAAGKAYISPYSKTSGIKILGDAYFDDGSGPQPIRLTKKEFFDRMGEAAAAEHASSNMDWWDNMHMLFNQKRWELGGMVTGMPSVGALVNLELDLEDADLLTPGPDMSRKRLKYYMDKKGPGSQSYKNRKKATSIAFGDGPDKWDTGFGLDLSDPGKLEMDLFYIPLWEDIEAFEAAKRRSGEAAEEVTQEEIYKLAMQRYRSMFKGRSDYGLKRMFSMYDHFYMASGPRFSTSLGGEQSLRDSANFPQEPVDPQDMSLDQLRGTVNVSGATE